MLFVISLIGMVLLVSGTFWLRNKWIVDTFNSYGVYGTMAGLYLYKKYGLWHIGNYQDKSSQSIEMKEAPESITSGELSLKPSYTR